MVYISNEEQIGFRNFYLYLLLGRHKVLLLLVGKARLLFLFLGSIYRDVDKGKGWLKVHSPPPPPSGEYRIEMLKKGGEKEPIYPPPGVCRISSVLPLERVVSTCLSI